MNQDIVLQKIKILQAQTTSIANTLTVLEKELAGGGAPSNSSKKVKDKTARFLARRDAKRKKPRGNEAS